MSDRAGIDSYRPGDSYLFEIAGLGGSGAISLLSAPVDVPPVTRAIEVPGATETLTFTLTESRKLSFDSLTDDSRIRWTPLGPQGALVAGLASDSSDSGDNSGSKLPAREERKS